MAVCFLHAETPQPPGPPQNLLDEILGTAANNPHVQVMNGSDPLLVWEHTRALQYKFLTGRQPLQNLVFTKACNIGRYLLSR